jgi:hypothetical protein
MAKLARLTGYTEGSASVTFGKIKRKLKSHTAGLDGANTNALPTSTPKKTGGPGRGKTGTPGSGAGKKRNGDGDDSPTKKAKATPKKSKKLVDEDDEDEFVSPRIKKEELGDLTDTAASFYQQPTVGAGMMGHGGLDFGAYGGMQGDGEDL